MRPAVTTLLTALLLSGALAGAGIVGGHSVNYVSADAQVTPDGTVLVEGAFVEESGWAVVHERTADGYGEALGATRLPRGNAFYTDVPVTIRDRAWRNWTAGTVVVVLHGEDGDGEFTADDPPLGGFGVIVTDRFVVERGPRAVVTAEDDFPQRHDAPTVTVRRATLPERGHLVVRNRTADGRVAGVRTLSAGLHRNVSVAVDESFYDATNGSFAARVSLHRADGDGFDGDEPAIRAGDATVATRFRVEPARAGGIVTTPVPTTAPPGGAEADAATGNGERDGGDGDEDGGGATEANEDDGGGPVKTDGQPGFGLAVTVAALGALGALALGLGTRRR